MSSNNLLTLRATLTIIAIILEEFPNVSTKRKLFHLGGMELKTLPIIKNRSSTKVVPKTFGMTIKISGEQRENGHFLISFNSILT